MWDGFQVEPGFRAGPGWREPLSECEQELATLRRQWRDLIKRLKGGMLAGELAGAYYEAKAIEAEVDSVRDRLLRMQAHLRSKEFELLASHISLPRDWRSQLEFQLHVAELRPELRDIKEGLEQVQALLQAVASFLDSVRELLYSFTRVHAGA